MADKASAGDAIIILGGLAKPRAEVAAALFHEHLAPRVFVSGQGDAVSIEKQLVNLGVPADSITVESDSASTFENAKRTAPLLRKAGIRRALIVTSWFHARRALRCFEHEAPDISFLITPERRPTRPNQYERRLAQAEYWKLLFYWVRYGIVPWG
jgi:uncharacterized SAM-binding protein YcdF (DUF218 family)